jgi:hypothetical protein
MNLLRRGVLFARRQHDEEWSSLRGCAADNPAERAWAWQDSRPRPRVYVRVNSQGRRSLRPGDGEWASLAKRTVHVVFNINYSEPLITILPAAVDAIDKAGPRGVELGLHSLQRADLRHDLESWRTGGPVVRARLPLEPNKITKPSAARAVNPVHPQQKRIPPARKPSTSPWPTLVSVIDEMKCRTP